MAANLENKETVLRFLKAVTDEKFDEARNCVTDDMTFTGVLGSRSGADAYIAEMKNMKLKYAVKKAFADGDDVAVFYDIDMGGKIIFSAGWYKIKEGKISSFRVIFDPRPLLKTGDNA